LAQTLGARADGAGLVAEALDSAGFRRSGHAKKHHENTMMNMKCVVTID
jgi:hypothetical protein